MIGGALVQPGDMLTLAEEHYAKHVLKVPERPPDTSFADYLESIRQVVLDPASGVFISRYGESLQAGFVRRSGRFRGPEGKEWLLVEYRVTLEHWVTAFQLSLDTLEGPLRSDLRWLRQPD